MTAFFCTLAGNRTRLRKQTKNFIHGEAIPPVRRLICVAN